MTADTKRICFLQQWGLLIAILGLIVMLLMPQPEGLSIVGQRVLAIFVFAVIIWMTEGVDYSLSAIVIASLMVLLIGTAPKIDLPHQMMGSSQSLAMTFKGFSNPSLILVTSALMIAIAMSKTGLDRRIALYVLSRVGTQTNRILIGTMIVSVLLSFLVPSTTARIACLVPIILGMMQAYGMDKKTHFCQMLLFAAAHMATIWNIGLLTGGTNNMVGMEFVQKQFGLSVSWIDWAIAAVPFAVLMSIALYFVLMKMLPPHVKHVKGGEKSLESEIKKLGPMSLDEKKILLVTSVLLFFWSTQKILHSFDTASVTIIGVTFLLLPKFGMLSWNEIQSKLPWGTIILLGIGLSLGYALLDTKAAGWLAHGLSESVGLKSFSVFGIFALLSLFLIVLHLGFASASALTSTMTPILIALFEMSPAKPDMLGMIMLMQFAISFGFVLPVNSPHNMLVYGTNSFEVKAFVKVGLVITAIGYALFLLMGATYWKWLGLV